MAKPALDSAKMIFGRLAASVGRRLVYCGSRGTGCATQGGGGGGGNHARGVQQLLTGLFAGPLPSTSRASTSGGSDGPWLLRALLGFGAVGTAATLATSLASAEGAPAG